MKRINLSLFNNILNMCKVLHWSTHSYSKHMALDQAYDAFKDSFDEYVECALGIYGRESAITTTINNKIVPEDIMISFVEDEFVNFNNEVAKLPENLHNFNQFLMILKLPKPSLYIV